MPAITAATYKNPQGTITADTPAWHSTATWNAAVTFTHIKANVTDTSSNAASLLMDLQVGGASVFKVGKGRSVQIGPDAPSANNEGRITALTSNSVKNWRIGFNDGVSGGLTFTPSTAAGGSTFTTPVLTLTDTVITAAQDVSVQADLTVTTAGGIVGEGAHHALGVNSLATNIGLRITSVFSSDGGANNFVAGVDLDPTLTLTSGANGYAAYLNVAGFGITTPASETVDVVASIRVTEPIVTVGGAGTVSEAATVYIASAPTEGVANYALKVNDGATWLQRITTGAILTVRQQGNFSAVAVINSDSINATDGSQLQFQKGAAAKWQVGYQIAGSAGEFEVYDSVAGRTALSIATGAGGTATLTGPIATSAPTGGAGAWELGVANAVSPTSPNRTITIEIGGTAYYLHAKTTND